MICFGCHKEIPNEALFCPYCGNAVPQKEKASAPTNPSEPAPDPVLSVPDPVLSVPEEEKASFGWSVLGFFSPLTGFILFLAFLSRHRARSKASGKGALVGAIVRVSLIVLLAFLFGFSMATNLFGARDTIRDFFEGREAVQEQRLIEETIDCDFGEFTVENNNPLFTETGLEVEIKNISTRRLTAWITFEAIDDNGDRILKDTVYIESLAAGKKITEEIFTFVDESLIEDMEDAEFRVVGIRISEND